jgi:hypothetical protein
MKNTVYLSLNEAAKQTERSKGTISKALSSGKLSYISKIKGRYQIDPSELFRVFPPKQNKSGSGVQLETQGETVNELIELRIKVKAIAEQLNREKEISQDLKEDRDQWRQQATNLLTDQRQKKSFIDKWLGK